VAQVLQQKLGQLKNPVFTGLLFGHNGQQFTLPIGINCQMDATAGTLQMLEPALA
jgi:muramoyltetrapeptide carboxypeptidase